MTIENDGVTFKALPNAHVQWQLQLRADIRERHGVHRDCDAEYRSRDFAASEQGGAATKLFNGHKSLTIFTKYRRRPQLHSSSPITQLECSSLACSLTPKS